MKKVFLVFCLAVFSLSFFSCRRQEAAAGPLQVGIMFAIDSLPVLIARDHGYFEQEGVEVNIVQFANPQERDAALQAGHLDASIIDFLAVAFFAAAGFDFRVTSATDGRFGIVASPQSGITSLEELRGRRIGISLNSIIQYFLDTKLANVGIPMTEYEAVSIPLVPLRLEMLMEGHIDATVIPEPVLTAAVAQGATLLATTEGTGIDPGIVFSQRVLNTRLDDVKAFYRAYYRAVQAINADPDAFRDYLVESVGFPASARDPFCFVTFRPPTLHERSQIEQVLDWLRARGLLTADLSPEDLIDTRAVGGGGW